MILYDVYRRLHQFLFDVCVKRPDQVVTLNQGDMYTGSMRRVKTMQVYAMALSGASNSTVVLHIFGLQFRPYNAKNVGMIYVAPGSRTLGFTGVDDQRLWVAQVAKAVGVLVSHHNGQAHQDQLTVMRWCNIWHRGKLKRN